MNAPAGDDARGGLMAMAVTIPAKAVISRQIR